MIVRNKDERTDRNPVHRVLSKCMKLDNKSSSRRLRTRFQHIPNQGLAEKHRLRTHSADKDLSRIPSMPSIIIPKPYSADSLPLQKNFLVFTTFGFAVSLVRTHTLPTMVDELEPPRKSVELEDSGAHPPGKGSQLLFRDPANTKAPDIPDINGSSDESEQFTDASEGHPGALPNPGDASPVPKTRVERVDDQPAHGEVPGTAAYKLRAKDAVPDEVEVIPDGQRSRASSRVRPEDRPSTPG